MNSPASTTAPRGLREWPHRLLKPILRRQLRRWDVHISGQELIPAQGPVILASNHVGWLDGPATVLTAPRPVHALTKSESFHGVAGAFLRFGGQIKLTRGQVDSGAVRSGLRVLHAGQVLLVYPEGRRGDGLVHEIYDGAAYFALVSGAPVVPLALFGTREPGGSAESKPAAGGRVDIVYGSPLTVDPIPWPRDASSVAEVSTQIADALRTHVKTASETLDRQLPGPISEQDTKTDD